MRRCIALALGCVVVLGADAAFARGGRSGSGHGGAAVGTMSGAHGSAGSGAHFRSASGAHFRSGGSSFHHKRVIVVGGAVYPFFPYYYPYSPYYDPYYYPQGYAEPAYAEEPVTYIEQRQQGGAGQVYYYCADSRAYYPNVTTCPSPWMKVVP